MSLDIFISFCELFSNKTIQITNNKLNKVFGSYSFYHISKVLTSDQNPQIYEKIKDSKIIIVNQTDKCETNLSDKYFIISFKQTIIYIKQNSVHFLQPLFSSNPNFVIYYLSNTKELFKQYITLSNKEFDDENDLKFKEEIMIFYEHFVIPQNHKQSINSIWKTIQTSITGYLIKNSYEKLNDRPNNMSIKQRTFKENDFIFLRMIGTGSIFMVWLIYHIEKGEIFAVKKPYKNDTEIPKLLSREVHNYSQINSPLFPKFYGIVETKNYPIIEFINGQTLMNINKFKFETKDKYRIIYEIMIGILNLQTKGFIYRDLKPNNVMIDQNERSFLIDFDRMIKYSENNDKAKYTTDFSTDFIAPEVNFGETSYKSDVYSIGQMIYYIINEECPNENHRIKISKKTQKTLIENMYLKCTNSNIEERFSVLELMIEFYSNFKPQIDQYIINYDEKVEFIQDFLNFKDEIGKNKKEGTDYNNYIRNINNIIHQNSLYENQNESNLYFYLGELYMNSKNAKQKIKKIIHYLSLASNHNCIEAQLLLGNIYYEGKLVNKNIIKSIKYFSLASNQNYTKAHLILGIIYYNWRYFGQNIKKAIHYFSLAADQNSVEAQFHLGLIYYTNKYIKQDITKSIHYFSLAANQNNSDAQYYLGALYYEGKFVERDINKSIHYFQLSANQNDTYSQYYLGLYYYEGKYAKRNINKAIYYFSLAANQNHMKAQYSLGNIYYDGEYIERCIEKAIYYYSCAANQHDDDSLYKLGNIYFNNQFVSRDINKAIHYFKLASNLNNNKAQFTLGVIFYEGKYISRDIEKSMYYFELSENKNNQEAQYYLGKIFCSSEFKSRDINKSIHYLTLSADQNNKEAQHLLGKIYYEFEYDIIDIDQSIYYHSLAASQNHVESQYILGHIFSNGLSVDKDIDKSIHYLTQAANQNHLDAQYELGNLYLELKDIQKSIHYYSLAANQNHLESLIFLGKIYLENKFVRRDIDKSIYYFILAAKQNNKYAQGILASIYYDNIYITRDINKTIYYLTLLANQNHKNAQYFLGSIYFYGREVLQDINKSLYYLSLSANQDFAEAQFLLGFIYFERKYNTRDINKAIHYFTLAARQNHIDAQLFLGSIYIEDINITKNVDKGIYYLTLCADNNNSFAQCILGDYYHRNNFIRKDINKSLYYLTLSSNQNNPEAQYILGRIYHEGKIVKPDVNKSIYYLTLSANQNHPDALYLLGIIYFEDIYIKQNLKEAIRYFTLAESKNQDARYLLGMCYLYEPSLSENQIKGVYLLEHNSICGHIESHFLVGYLYHEGKYVKRNIKISIEKYKAASTYNYQYAKNNLGIIYKNGYFEEIPQDIGKAISYFEDAIKQANDHISMYNLSHIYIYKDNNKQRIDKSIELLIKSIKSGFFPSKLLLCIALIKKHEYDISLIKQELKKKLPQENELSEEIIHMINNHKLCNEAIFKKEYEYFENIDFIYDGQKKFKISKELIQQHHKNTVNQSAKNITKDFYDGFNE